MRIRNSYEICRDLIGPIRPCGEHGVDIKRYENLEETIYVINRLLEDVTDGLPERNSREASVKQCGDRVQKYISDLKEWLDDLSEEPPTND